MRVLLSILLLSISLQLSSVESRGRKKISLESNLERFMNDGLLGVEPLPPQTVEGQCTCECCTQAPEIFAAKCPSDIVIGIDSSACFRDYHGKMNRFLKKLVRRIDRNQNIQYGQNETRLSLMQFSSDILYPVELNDFENYSNPPTSRLISKEIVSEINSLKFLGEGSFLNKALNASVNQFLQHPRPAGFKDDRVLIMLTNGNSHPEVRMSDIENSIRGLKEADVSVIPVAVTRECYGNPEAWGEGLCPDPVVLKKLANLGAPQNTFMEMNSQDTIPDILTFLQCAPSGIADSKCNNCTCSCELPVGPQGPPGPKGPKGDFVEGEPGEKGDIGPKGEVGRKGSVGPRGDKGIGGDKGGIGEPGVAGIRGPKGTKGEFGDKGDIGPKGGKGSVGPKGDKGVDGFEGPKGGRGDKGEDGEKGNVGDKGNIGDKGFTGPPGPRGPKGFGEKGMTGPPGDDGTKGGPGNPGGPGDKGMTGPPGLCGKPGPAGFPGEKGMTGNDGKDGESGPPGTQGPRGETGRRGDKGNAGEPGVPGLPGSSGLTGERGPQGPQGPYGNKGEKGEPSNVPGSPGLPGVPGAKGRDGFNGEPGVDGRDGPAGRQGPRGESGPRGPPGEIDLDRLRPILVEIIREMIPGDCIEKTPCREYPIDVAFLVDGSDSIDREDFERTQNWILTTVDAFKKSSRNIPLYVSVVQYSERSQIEVDQLVLDGSQEIRNTVQNIEQMRSGTKTYSALQFVLDNVYRLMRPTSFKILITMTDGDASEPRNIEAINLAHEEFDMMVAVGVGSKTDREELLDFSSSERIFSVENFESLEGIIADIIGDICSGLDQALESTTSSSGNTVLRVRRHHKKRKSKHHQH